MIPADVLRQIRRLRVRARRAVRAAAGGEYRSAFRGAGLSFEEVRAYQPGDDIRAVDWNVTARIGTPFVKRYAEERELTVLLVVDLSASLGFGTGRPTKRAVAGELAAVLALTAAAHQDRVGWVGVTDRVERLIPPGKGTRHAVRVVRDVLTAAPISRGTDLAAGLAAVARGRRRRSVVFVLSDFLGCAADPRFAAAFRRAARQHDVTAVRIADPVELAWPAAGLVALEDAETGAQTVIDAGDPAFRRAFADRAAADRDAFTRLARSAPAGLVEAVTDGRHFDALAHLFETRGRRGPS